MLIDSTYPPQAIWNSLKDKKPVFSGKLASRSKNQAQFRRRVTDVASKFGVTRLADITGFSQIDLAVFQSTRPQIYSHWTRGENTGSQGKGLSRDQAIISSLMESLEAFSVEPRNAQLIRSSYHHLKHMYKVVNPSDFLCSRKFKSKGLSKKQMMWTGAVSLTSGDEVLVPAESAFFPFFPATYDTQVSFPCDSNGIGAGASYSEAVLAGLYELIERHYRHIWLYENHSKVVGVVDEESWLRPYRKILRHHPEVEIRLYSIVLDIPNVPVMLAIVTNEDSLAHGTACHFDPHQAAHKAITEAFQVLATASSGAREDMNEKFDPALNKYDGRFMRALKRLPTVQALDLSNRRAVRRLYSQSIGSKNLGLEVENLVGWVAKVFSTDVFAVNHTRHGIEIPVVKIIVPGLRSSADEIIGGSATEAFYVSRKYGITR